MPPGRAFRILPDNAPLTFAAGLHSVGATSAPRTGGYGEFFMSQPQQPVRFRDQAIAFAGIGEGKNAGYGRKGARIGSRPGEAELFRADMLTFWQGLFGKPACSAMLRDLPCHRG
jgi:hypothetical protein